MNFNSIITNIKIGFTLTLLLFVLVFLAFLQHSSRQEMRHTANFYETIQVYLESNKLEEKEASLYIKSLNFEYISEDKHKFILDNAEDKFGAKGFEIVNLEGNFYLHILTPHFRILFKDLNIYERNYFGHILFGILFIAFVVMYTWIMRALSPLKSLKKEIQKFANGDLDINCKSDKKDEIAELANEFDKAVKKIGLLLSSRQLFLRTIMHELKTPIAKGRIVSELIDDEKQKRRIISIFEKLNYQINDFAKIEEIVSNNYKPHIYRCTLEAVTSKSIEMLMLDSRENISIQGKLGIVLNADLELLALAFKNLIDNALKYSTDKKVSIVSSDEKIEFISNAEKLTRPIEEYFKPFHNDTKNKNHGMGLGIYIVNSILSMHAMKLEYRYENGRNIFSVIYPCVE